MSLTKSGCQRPDALTDSEYFVIHLPSTLTTDPGGGSCIHPGEHDQLCRADENVHPDAQVTP